MFIPFFSLPDRLTHLHEREGDGKRNILLGWPKWKTPTVYITIIPCARVGYNHFISNKGKWNNCFSKFSNRVLPPIFISTILQSVRKENLAHYFPFDVKLRLLAHSRSFLANQKARNAIVGAENLLNINIFFENVTNEQTSETMLNFRM